VAKINPVKVKQDAEKEERAGRFDKAILLYRQLVDDNPRDWNTIKKIGDLYVRLNKNKEASSEYAKVAEFYSRDGFLLKAIAVWKQINKLDPSALDPYVSLADLYAKQGLMVEAKGQYQIVVDEYIKRGRVREAGDALKKMADIDPSDLKVRSKLADLYTRDGNSQKAVEEHIAIADELHRKGHLAEALQVLEKGLRIDSKSVRLRTELARIHIVQKNYEKAIHCLEDVPQRAPDDAQAVTRLGEAYLGAKRIGEAETLFRKLLQRDPDNQEARTQMGRVFLLQGHFDQAYEQLLPVVERLVERKEGERAAALLQQIIQRSPAHLKSLNKLVDVYRHLRKESAVILTYSQLTEAYINQGQMDQAAAVLEILQGLEPQNEQHRSKLEFVRRKPQGAGAREAQKPGSPPPPDSFVEEDFELAAPEEPGPALAAPASYAASRATIELSGPLTEEDREFVDEHLAEGRVFRKYGLVDKAADQFDAVISRFPDNVEARQELQDIFKEKGQTEKAVEQLVAMAEIHRLKGNEAAAAQAEADAEALKPKVASPPPVETPAPPPPVPPSTPIAMFEPEEEAADEEIPLEVEESGLEGPTLEVADEGGLPQLDLGDTGGDELSGQFLDEEPERPELGAGRGTASSADEARAEELGSQTFDDEAISFEEEGALTLDEPESEAPPAPPPPKPVPPVRVPPSAKPVAARVSPRPMASPPPAPPLRRSAVAAKIGLDSALPADLQRVLAEAEEFISLGFVDDAKDALHEISLRYPDHAAVAAKRAELGLDRAAPAPRASTAPAPRSEPELFDESEPAPFEASDLVDEEPAAPEASLVGGLDDAFSDLDLAEPAPEPEPQELSEPELAPAVAESEMEMVGEFSGGIDLGAELGDLFGAQSAVGQVEAPIGGTDFGDAGLADIFKEFKKGVDKQLGKEDYDTRYNLGIAYKEMGLIDEAIAEFQLAAKDEGRLLECSSMLGICFLEKGMPKLAVKWFEKGLTAPGRSEEEYQGLKYDLAMAHEASGELDRALSLFTDLYGQNANFRDVATKVRELGASAR
jgi:tetratricopeptide (TPR) repeat protein